MLKSKSEVEKNVMAILLGEEPDANQNTPKTLSTADLIPFADHPFKLYEDERLDDMVRSVKELGVIIPIIVRPFDEAEGTYEILSGHNRVNAAKIADLTKVPVVIKTGLTDDEAKLIVTETNLVQRSFADLSYSERAIALKQHLEALKSANGGQGKRSDIFYEIEKLSNPSNIKENSTSPQVGEKLLSVEKAGEKYGLSKNSVARYVRLTHLISALLSRVDIDEIAFIPAVTLSYLSPDEQTELDKLLNESAYKIDIKKAESLREFSERKKLTNENMMQILSGDLNKKSKPKITPPLKIKAKIYLKYFSSDATQAEMESVVDQALTEYFENHK